MYQRTALKRKLAFPDDEREQVPQAAVMDAITATTTIPTPHTKKAHLTPSCSSSLSPALSSVSVSVSSVSSVSSISPISSSLSSSPDEQEEEEEEEEEETPLKQISRSARTPFEKRVWRLLCQIPRGHTTTYAALAAALGTSPRAVGNACRRNPLAPAVPCHRVVAVGGGLGGFKGQKVMAATGRGGRGPGPVRVEELEEGTTLVEKRRLLRLEGVRFDARGRVVGSPFTGFV